MDQFRWKIACFSPTGTTAKVAKAIAQGSGCPVHEVDLTVPVPHEALEQDEILLAAVPVYGGRVPAVALDRLASLKGSGQKAVAVVVYGNRAYDDAMLELKDSLEENGFLVVAAGAFVAEHSMARSIAAGRPDARDLEIAAKFGSDVMKKLEQKTAVSIQVPGNPAYKGKQGMSMPGHPHGGKGCVSCGVCAKACPVGAIPAGKPQETDGSKCIVCMRCVSVCPQKARALPVPMQIAVTGMMKVAASTPKQPELFL